MQGIAFDGSLLPVGRSKKFSKKSPSFSKKIWQQAKAAYLCAPLLKKGIALKKGTTLYAIEKGKRFGDFIKPPTFATRSKKH
jgi:hypothetical protein